MSGFCFPSSSVYADNHESTSEGRPLRGRWSKWTLIHHDLARAPIGLSAVPNQFVVPLVPPPPVRRTPPGDPPPKADLITPTSNNSTFQTYQIYLVLIVLSVLFVAVIFVLRILLPKFSRAR